MYIIYTIRQTHDTRTPQYPFTRTTHLPKHQTYTPQPSTPIKHAGSNFKTRNITHQPQNQEHTT